MAPAHLRAQIATRILLMMLPLAVHSYTTTSAAGLGKAATASALREGRSALVPNDLAWAPLDC